MTEPRAYTSDELRDMLIEQSIVIARYWASLPDVDKATGNAMTVQSRCDGVVFSILAMLDGSSDLPGVDLVFRPHPDDKEYLRSEGSNWVEDGTIVSDTLHEHMHRVGKTME